MQSMTPAASLTADEESTTKKVHPFSGGGFREVASFCRIGGVGGGGDPEILAPALVSDKLSLVPLLTSSSSSKVRFVLLEVVQ